MLTPTAAEEFSAHDCEEKHWLAAGMSRRTMLAASMALAGAALAGAAQVFAQAAARPTSEDALGPFFPLTLPADTDFDMTMIQGNKARAAGQLLYLSGRVLNTKGEPVSGAVLEVWQANAVGRYAHPGDDSKAPLDSNFQGYARIVTGADGGYRLKTINPGPYGGRTRHIHFDIKGTKSRVISQMYFEGEAKNESDGLFKRQSESARKTLLAKPIAPTSDQEKDALVMNWDVVLAFG